VLVPLDQHILERFQLWKLARGTDVARYQRKRARELKHDRFRDTTLNTFDKIGDKLEGKGRAILYGIGAVLLLAILLSAFSWWRGRKNDEARRALGRAIEIAEAPVTPSPSPGIKTPTFPTETARAQMAVEEFQKVANKYSDPYNEIARYFIATNLLTIDRAKGISQLEGLSRSGDNKVAALSKFALAQAKEADAQYDAAAALYSDLAKQNNEFITGETANLRLASVYQKLDKKKEAADIFFNIVDAARKAKDQDGKPAPQSAAAREAAQQLEKLDPARFAQLPPEPTASDLAL
jgi:hypothetical protein